MTAPSGTVGSNDLFRHGGAFGSKPLFEPPVSAPDPVVEILRDLEELRLEIATSDALVLGNT